MVQLNPHLVAVNLNCYGHGGPWKIRSGFEQLAQTVSGMAIAQRENGIPQLGPTYPNDYLTGYLATLGVLMALEIQGREGGAWQVDVHCAEPPSGCYSRGACTTGGPPNRWMTRLPSAA
ncbi:CoA transferase [Lelliottia amnigena]|nr:CoA transferase [Lelliottia amnigena]MBM7354582.1 crotonobetainyl-CoA:carnitine CoA-transferase CaiB-like acyl-CoA transferase [Lelliottia amnigena]WSO20966.1 CoA transferase [Lelliottia amnigena]